MVAAGLVVRYMNTSMRIGRADNCVLSVLTLHLLVTFTNTCLMFMGETGLHYSYTLLIHIIHFVLSARLTLNP